MHGKGRGPKTVAGLLTSLGLVVPVAALPACGTSNPGPMDAPVELPDGPVGTENPPPPFDAPRDMGADVADGALGTENPPAPFDVDEEDAGADDAGDEDAADDDAGDEDADSED